ncbi:head-tail adaptor protein [Methylosinus sp. Sm6]|uniref:phage head completion protein n=1 Tax=Methylosinus sp. Sm6 TaxID=2866948 RepID=UPI001C990FAB|nr:head-tail adaptor protein [Methylosinus sp. Sm6]MBY6242836.1 head-tail adaptor protein [Methylosinus sp. Sm6]
MQAGRMRYAITIRRRELLPDDPDGAPRGDFADAFTTRAAFVQLSALKAAEAGLVEDQAHGVLTVYDCAQNRSITVADRVRIEGVDWSIESVSIPDRMWRSIKIGVARKMGG